MPIRRWESADARTRRSKPSDVGLKMLREKQSPDKSPAYSLSLRLQASLPEGTDGLSAEEGLQKLILGKPGAETWGPCLPNQTCLAQASFPGGSAGDQPGGWCTCSLLVFQAALDSPGDLGVLDSPLPELDA